MGRSARGSKREMRSGEAHRLGVALVSLDARDRQILELRYGLDGTAPQSLRQIGARLGITGERVRQLEQRALRRLGPKTGTSAAQRVAAAKALVRPEVSLTREALEAWTLLLLRGQPAYGYELCKSLAERGFHASGPRVYRLLRDLDRGGLVRSDWAPSSAVGPNRRIYTLTRKGTRQLHHGADILHRRCETLRLFLEHYAQTPDPQGRDKPHRRAAATNPDHPRIATDITQ